MINEVIERGIIAGIPIKCEYILNRGFVYEIDGFYKSDTISIELEDGKLIATARYNEKTEITDPEDIVRLNYEWWSSSKYGSCFWEEPGDLWKKLFDTYKLDYSKEI